MNKKKWTNEENKKLIKEFATKSNKELSEMFNRSEKSIIQHAHELKLYKNKQILWKEHEIEFLKKHYNKDMSPLEISKILNRSISSIKSKAFSIGLTDNSEWTNEQLDYLIDNYCYKTNEEIGQKIGRSEQAVSYKAFELSLSINENWTEEEINILKTNYLNRTMNELQQLLSNKTKGDILSYCHKLGLTRLKKTCTRDYFNVIDTEEKAYWLGFIYADGYISFSESNFKKGQISSAYCVGIKLQKSDKEHLKKFNKSINGNYKIFDEILYPDGFRKKKTVSCKILIYSKQMYDDLNVFFGRDKTYTAQFPNIPQNLIRHFIRGYFDGDGCFTYTEKSYQIGFVTASSCFYNGLKNILKEKGFNPYEYTKISKYDTKIYYMRLNRIKEKYLFLKWIYDDCNIYLDRKYQKYLNVLKNTTLEKGLAV